jgi:aminoglycoside phosphotransferase (APT) family kinase protein
VCSAIPHATLGWALAAIGEGSKLIRAEVLKGGSSSAVYAVDFEDSQGRAHELVLRRFTDARWLAEEPDLAQHEGAALQVASQTGVPSPTLVALDWSRCDVPSVLMTRMPGSADLHPRHAEALADTLTQIHSVQEPSLGWHYKPWFDVERLDIPDWTEHPHAWRVLHDRLRAGPPSTSVGFLHRDFHPGNILFQDGRISAVVDWVNACIGPLEVDVSHCRANLAVLHDLETADVFDRRYRAITNAQPADPYWDAAELAGIGSGFEGLLAFRAFGAVLTPELIKRRFDWFAAAAARRLP